MRQKAGVVAATLIGAFVVAVLAGILPMGSLSLENSRTVEASGHELQTLYGQSVTNQQAASSAIAVHGADMWHEAGFKGEGVKIGVIDRGFAGIQELMGAGLPEPVGVRCYYLVTDPTITDNFTEDLSDCLHEELGTGAVGAAVLEAVHDIAPDAEYYIASISQDSFYHFDLAGIVEWMNGEGVDLILFTHDGGWSGPGDGTSVYAASELATLDRAVSLGITWISPTGDRAEDTWSGFFTDTNSNGFHEFAPGVECNGVDLDEPNSAFAAQIRWNDPWLTATRDLEVDLINEETGDTEAISDRHDNLRGDPNELVVFLTPDTPSTYCLRIELKSESNSPLIFNLQSYNGHSLEHPSIYGSVTSPAESVNLGMLAVGAAPVDNTSEIRPFSGRGPMNNRTTKPDIVGADGAYSQVLGRNWDSTAQAAAHVAGLSALVKQRFPSYTPQQIADYLKENAASRPAEVGDLSQSADLNNTWGHGFAMLPDDAEGVSPPSQADPLEATKAYVNDAIAAYRDDPEAALTYYRSEESIVNDPPGLYLTLLDGDTIKVNPTFRGAEESSIAWRDDPLGNRYGAQLAAADEDGVVLEYLIPIPSQDYTYRKKTAWAIRASVPDIDNPGETKNLVFSAGWLDLEEDVESTFTEAQKAVGAVIEARARVQVETAAPTLDHYRSTDSIDGEIYVWLAFPTGRIAADPTMPELVGRNIADVYPDIGEDILAVQTQQARWITHMWQNPATGQVESKNTYVTRFFGFYIVSGYYDEVPPVVGPRAAAQAYVEEAIRAHREDPVAAREYYQSEASVDRENDLYLILVQGTEIIVNGGFSGVVGDDITGRIGVDAIGKEYGKEIAAADEAGRFVTYLIPDPRSMYTLYRKHTWAIKADGLIFAAGSWDKNEDVESTLEPHEDVIAAIYKAGARLLAQGGPATFQFYNTPASRDGERYVFIIDGDGVIPGVPPGTIIADVTRPDLLRTNISSLQASDVPDLGQRIAAVGEGEELWISHMWRNPATGQEEQKHTYVTKFRGLIFGSGYYGDTPPPGSMPEDTCFTTIGDDETTSGTWDDTCLSENRPQHTEEGGNRDEMYYARFYTFTLDEDANVAITLTSDDNPKVDAFLYLIEGMEKEGFITFDDDSAGDTDSKIEPEGPLSAGTYTIEATSYHPVSSGNFTLRLDVDTAIEPPPPDVEYIAISSGANHVCAIATDGSIMCWGNEDGDSHGQVSNRPRTGSFKLHAQISSGATHTCALRDDGAVVCWGSFTLP